MKNKMENTNYKPDSHIITTKVICPKCGKYNLAEYYADEEPYCECAYCDASIFFEIDQAMSEINFIN